MDIINLTNIYKRHGCYRKQGFLVWTWHFSSTWITSNQTVSMGLYIRKAVKLTLPISLMRPSGHVIRLRIEFFAGCDVTKSAGLLCSYMIIGSKVLMNKKIFINLSQLLHVWKEWVQVHHTHSETISSGLSFTFCEYLQSPFPTVMIHRGWKTIHC